MSINGHDTNRKPVKNVDKMAENLAAMMMKGFLERQNPDIGLEIERFVVCKAGDNRPAKPMDAKAFNDYMASMGAALEDRNWKLQRKVVLDNGTVSELHLQKGENTLILTAEPSLALEVAFPPHRDIEAALRQKKEILSLQNNCLPEGYEFLGQAISPFSLAHYNDSYNATSQEDIYLRVNGRFKSQKEWLESLDGPIQTALGNVMYRVVADQATFGLFCQNAGSVTDKQQALRQELCLLYAINLASAYLSQNSYGENEGREYGSVRNTHWHSMFSERTGIQHYIDNTQKITVFEDSFSLVKYFKHLFHTVPMFMVYGDAEDGSQDVTITSGLTMHEWTAYYQNPDKINLDNKKHKDVIKIGRPPTEADIGMMLRSVWPDVRLHPKHALAELRSCDHIDHAPTASAITRLQWYAYTNPNMRQEIANLTQGWTGDTYSAYSREAAKIEPSGEFQEFVQAVVDSYCDYTTSDDSHQVLRGLMNDGTFAQRHRAQQMKLVP